MGRDAMNDTGRNSDREKIKEMLRATRGSEGGLCSWQLYANYMPNGRNEISRMKRLFGWGIDAPRVSGEGDRPPHCHYFLTHDPERDDPQMRLVS